MTAMSSPIRLDKWLWHARFAKTRKDAATLIGKRRVRINSEVIEKAHRQVRLGDVLTLTLKSDVLVLRVTGMAARRGAKADARTLYDVIDSNSMELA